MTNPTLHAAECQDSPMPAPKVVMISCDLLEAYVQLQRAAEYQVLHHADDTVQMVVDALAAVRKAGEA